MSSTTLPPRSQVPTPAAREDMDPYERWTTDRRRVGLLAGQVAQVHADLVEAMIEVMASKSWVGEGINSPEHWLVVYAACSPAHAKDIVRVATRAGDDIPELLELLRQGRLTLDQAAVVAKHAPANFSQSILRLAQKTTVTQLRRVLSRYVFQDVLSDDPPSPRLLPELSMNIRGGRFHMRLVTDAAQGAVIEQAVREAKDALFTTGHTDATMTDAVVEMAHRSLAAVESADRRDRYRVYLHLDTEGSAWINKHGAVPRSVIDRYTCDGVLQPVWETDSKPVSVGRTMRIVPARTRRLVEDRDRGCRFPGCGSTRYLENHHVHHWADGGRSDFDDVISLCGRHHDRHHQGQFRITADGQGQFEFLNRWGHPIRAHLPEDHVPLPPRPDPDRPNILHETVEAASLVLAPNPDP